MIRSERALHVSSPAISAGLRRAACVVLISAPLLAGCMRLESLEQRQIRADTERMRRGEPLVHHKDTLELSEHKMAMRVGKPTEIPGGEKGATENRAGQNRATANRAPRDRGQIQQTGGEEAYRGAFGDIPVEPGLPNTIPAYSESSGRTSLDSFGPDPTPR